MHIHETRLVKTHRVEFTEEETAKLKKLGWLPAQLDERVEMWLQDEQLKEWQLILSESIPYPPPLV